MTAPACRAQMPRHYLGGRAHLWGAVDAGSGEVETIEFLYALVRLQKPKRCLELGTGQGIAARAIGEALRDNGRGVLFTFDVDQAAVRQAGERTEGLPVACRLGHSQEIDIGEVDFLFVDSGEPAGWPDFLLVKQDGSPLCAIEVKVGHDAVQPHQAQMHNSLRKAGLQTLIGSPDSICEQIGALIGIEYDGRRWRFREQPGLSISTNYQRARQEACGAR